MAMNENVKIVVDGIETEVNGIRRGKSIYVNVTPHTINVWNKSGEKLMDVPACGIQCRAAQVVTELGVEDDIPLYGVVIDCDSITGVPESQEGVKYITSRLAAEGMKSRKDILIPGQLARNAEGQPIGCYGLTPATSL